MRARGGAVGWGTALKAERPQVRFPMVSLKFFIDIILPAALWFWGWLSNDYQEYFLQGKGGRCVGLTNLPLSCADYLEIREPQSPGNLRACTCIALPFYWLMACDEMFGQKFATKTWWVSADPDKVVLFVLLLRRCAQIKESSTCGGDKNCTDCKCTAFFYFVYLSRSVQIPGQSL